jgi:hypothetical protein
MRGHAAFEEGFAHGGLQLFGIRRGVAGAQALLHVL